MPLILNLAFWILDIEKVTLLYLRIIMTSWACVLKLTKLEKFLLLFYLLTLTSSAGYSGLCVSVWPQSVPAMWPHAPDLSGAGVPGALVQGRRGGAHLQLWREAWVLEPGGTVEWTKSVWDKSILSAQLQSSRIESGKYPCDRGWHIQVQGGLQGKTLKDFPYPPHTICASSKSNISVPYVFEHNLNASIRPWDLVLPLLYSDY